MDIEKGIYKDKYCNYYFLDGTKENGRYAGMAVSGVARFFSKEGLKELVPFYTGKERDFEGYESIKSWLNSKQKEVKWLEEKISKLN